MTGGLFKEKELFIFCKSCHSVVRGRPLLCCSACKEVRRWPHKLMQSKDETGIYFILAEVCV